MNKSFLTILLGGSVILSACTKEQDFAKVVDPEKLALSSSSGPVVCGFGGGGGGTDPNKGIIADLLYMNPTANVDPNGHNNMLSYYFYTIGDNASLRQQTCGGVPANPLGKILFTTDFVVNQHYGPLPTSCNVPNNTKVDVLKGTSQLFLKELNTTMEFSQGFQIINDSGAVDYLKTPSGDKLIEYFSLKLRGRLSLKDLPVATYPNGNYILQIKSDDGSVVKVKDPTSGTYNTLISNDGYRSTTDSPAVAATTTVTIDRNSYLDYTIDYFQGPRTSIQLILSWKKPNASTFEVVPSDAYFLPDGITNPCH